LCFLSAIKGEKGEKEGKWTFDVGWIERRNGN
jgi:hypothetical protein